MTRRYFIPCVLAVAFVGGCASDDIARLQAARDQTVSMVAQAKQAEGDIRTQVASLPATDPVSRALTPRLAELDAVIARGEQYLPVVDGAIRSAQSGTIDPGVQAAVGAIPYGPLALAVVGIVWGAVKHQQASGAIAAHEQTRHAFNQLVSAMDAAVPDPTPAQNAAIASELDNATKARVAVSRTA